MPGAPTWPLYDAVLNGRLAATLLRYQAEGLGSRKITERLEVEHGISPSYRTVARWLVSLNNEQARKEAS